MPNVGLSALLVACGGLLVGSALIIGLATRDATIAGVVVGTASWFAKGHGFLDAQNHDSVWLIILIVLAGAHAGHVIGLDGRFAGRFRFLA